MNDETRWRAVLERDRGADGAFVYAVRSTRVACRPSCGSRRPRRSNVSFFPSIAEAVAADYRPCRRCRPQERDPDAADRALVRHGCALIQQDPGNSLRAVAKSLAVTPHRLQRLFRRWLGVSPREYRAACRLSRFQRDGASSPDTLDAVLAAGYGSSPRLYEHRGLLGMTPGRYRRGGAGERVRIAIGDSDLGHVLVAATDAGVCAVRFGHSRDTLLAELKAEFSAAELIEDGGSLAPWLRLLQQYVAGRALMIELPLDVSGSLFQLRVWSALRSIPPGESRTYGEIASQVGGTAAARAVAQACASNPAALAIPCHRVVPKSGGGAGGYRWGKARKERLLSQERRSQTAGV